MAGGKFRNKPDCVVNQGGGTRDRRGGEKKKGVAVLPNAGFRKMKGVCKEKNQEVHHKKPAVPSAHCCGGVRGDESCWNRRGRPTRGGETTA